MEALYTDRARNEIGAPPSISPAVRGSFSGRRYSCRVSDTGLNFCDETNDNTEYQAYISGYLPLLTPKLTKAGKVAVHQPQIPKRSTKWWKAQCGFRGLPVGGNLRDLQDRIRKPGDKGLSSSMKEACEKMEKDYVAENAGELEKVWLQNDNNEKAKLWPKGFLYESFMVHPGLSKEALVVEVDGWGEKMEAASRQMKVYCEMRKMPDHETGQRLVVVGLNEQAVRSRFAEIGRDAERSAMRALQEQKERQQETLDDFEEQFSMAKSKGRSSRKKWDVSGQWEISCPYMDEEWGSENDACTLEIGFTKPIETGLVQMYASFDFIAMTGIMRFVNENARDDARDQDNKKRSSRKPDLTPDEDLDDEEDSDEVDDSDHDGSMPADFLFPNASLPSSRSREFSFRWRGEETGESQIQLGSDKNLCSIKFESPNALTGVFISGLTGSVDFKGFKEGFETAAKEGGARTRQDVGGCPDPSIAWRERSEAAYEIARVGRWGKGRW